MKWTQDKPTAEGWYWAEDVFGDVAMVLVQHVPTYWHVWSPDLRKESGVDAFEWWYGPLSYPYRLTIKEAKSTEEMLREY